MPRKALTKQEKVRRYRWRRYMEVYHALGGKCAHCDETDPRKLQVDHVEPAGHRGSAIWLLSREKLAEELPRCQLLCVPCHVEKTRLESKARASV